MAKTPVATQLFTSNESKIVLLVLDGLGGLPGTDDDRTELEIAKTPNLDRLAKASSLGLTDPVGRGITPGSGPAHLSLFGYDPLVFNVGRGVLAALGVGFELQPADVAARINFATVDDEGTITDRRAGRLPTERNRELCAKLEAVEIPGIDIFIRTVKEYRATVIFRGEDLSGELADSDPQQVGLKPRKVEPLVPEAAKTAELANDFIAKANKLLAGDKPANQVLLRGFAKYRILPTMEERYGLKSAAIACYPMYLGLARLVGMSLLDTGETIEDEVATLAANLPDHDFFYLHVKKTDSSGEDGNVQGKVEVLESFDALLPRVLDLKPDVLVITGDHSTPCRLKSHSWHPVPFLLHSPWCITEPEEGFAERLCARGMLGRFPAWEALTLMLAHARRLEKFGA